MARPSRRPPQLRRKVFRGSAARAAGLLTQADLRSTAWRRLYRDVYADRAVTVSHALLARTACEYVLPSGVVVAGRSAALLHGVDLLRHPATVEVAGPSPVRVDGIAFHLVDLAAYDVIRQPDGLRLTTPVRTCWDLAQWLDLPDAVAYLDRLLARRIVAPQELLALERTRPTGRGARRFARMLAHSDARSESPQESRLRVRLILAGLPAPIPQFVLSHEGRFVARVDLAWPSHQVAVEYDGRWHADPAQLERDRARLNRILGTDWVVLHVTAARLRDDFDGFVAELRAALRARP